MRVLCKFYVTKIERYHGDSGAVRIGMSAVYKNLPGVEGNACEENRIFSKYTPSAELTMRIENPEAAAQFELGAQYYVSFDRSEEPIQAP